MMPMSLFLAIAAQIAAPAPPPIFIPSAPPSGGTVARGPIITLDVEVRGGGALLWSGQLRVADRSPASFTRQQSGAAQSSCTSSDDFDEHSERSSLSIYVSTARQTSTGTALDIRATWDRPSDSSGCKTRRSTRTVGIAETISLGPGGEQTVSGDGGLTIRLRRR
jgi:hypothetical protein